MIHSEGGMVRRGDQKVLVAIVKGKDANIPAILVTNIFFLEISICDCPRPPSISHFRIIHEVVLVVKL